jgi:hypothetical protein
MREYKQIRRAGSERKRNRTIAFGCKRSDNNGGLCTCDEVLFHVLISISPEFLSGQMLVA